ncbi:hypothetical protein GCM10011611_13630 [Aliidongia dinghuensis]|uniref:Uncharacterized protein n=1 Tax=Aliidongia dinghuensis TaxID=1867774 RepID=A0A8J2YQZ9_9PROT|nr:hypothetical protein GCM10011611_13630 [Aliidongia dinghuensis]
MEDELEIDQPLPGRGPLRDIVRGSMQRLDRDQHAVNVRVAHETVVYDPEQGSVRTLDLIAIRSIGRLCYEKDIRTFRRRHDSAQPSAPVLSGWLSLYPPRIE